MSILYRDKNLQVDYYIQRIRIIKPFSTLPEARIPYEKNKRWILQAHYLLLYMNAVRHDS